VFLEASAFPFLPALEARWREVREECLGLPDDAFDPWVQREMYGQGWTVYGLIAFGQRIEGALARCPRTAEALSHVPHVTTAGFSRLAPGAHIAPHVGWVTTVYRAHLGLVVPEGCALRVGEQTRAWREGEVLVFDDTTEHEAYNRSAKPRTVLLFDFARPGREGQAPDVPPAAVREMIRKRTER
jgi:aspartyl/asparaginyl beta-hydroxylase (cupin superfamily)